MATRRSPARRTATRKPQSPSLQVVTSPGAGSGEPPGDDGATDEVVFDAEQDPGAIPASIARTLMREVMTFRTPLAAELVVSDVLGMAQLACPPEANWAERAEVADVLACAVATTAERDGSAPALALLRALAALALPKAGPVAAEAADRLAAEGVPDRPWAQRIGRPQFVRAWRFGDAFGFQESVHVMFDYASREHVLAVLIDHPLGGGIKDCWFAEGKQARRLRAMTLARAGDDDPGVVFEDIDHGRTGELLTAALASEPCPEQDDQIEDVAKYLYLTAARVAHLGAPAGDG